MSARHLSTSVAVVLGAAAAGIVTLAPAATAAPAAPTTAPSFVTSSGGLEFDNEPLSQVLDEVAEATHANVSVDWRALEADQVSRDVPIKLRLTSAVSLRKAVQLVLKQAGGTSPLTFYIDDGIINVTTEEKELQSLVTRTYSIQDLLFTPTDYHDAPSLDLSQIQGQSAGGGGGGGGSSSQNLFGNSSSSSSSTAAPTREDRAQSIITLITTTVKPEVWQANGGTSTISYVRGMLVVHAPRSVQAMIASR